MLKIIGEIIDFSVYWGIMNKINCEAKMEVFGTAGELAKKYIFFSVVKSKYFISRFFFVF